MTCSRLRIVVYLAFIGAPLLGAPLAAGQSSPEVVGDEFSEERGLPFPSQHYAPPEYGQNHQNWAVAQDDQGLTYVANNDGVMQYDGERWRLIPTTTGSLVRSLAVDSLVFVGTKGDFGYLRPDSFGVFRYRSLYEHIPEGERDFEDVWKTLVLSDGTYFQANERLFRWDGSEMTSWNSEEGFHTSFAIGDSLYVRDFERGLLQIKGDSLMTAPGGEVFSDMSIHMMASHPSGNVLIGTAKNGLFLYDGHRLQSFAPAVTSYFEEHDLYHGCRLPGDRYALATLGGGILIINADGQILRVLDKSSGLPDEVVNYVFAGQEGQLWAALNNNGVYRADLNAPTTLHDERTGLEGVIRSMSRHDGRIHVATGSGLYVLRENETESLGEQRARFEKIDGIPLSWDLLSTRDVLLAGTNEGVIQISGQENQKVTNRRTYDLISSDSENIVYAGTRVGVKILRRMQHGWGSFPVEGIEEEIRSIATGPDGHLWITSIDGDILRLEFSDDHHKVLSKIVFDESNGLPDIYKVPMTLDGQIAIRSNKGIYQVDNPEAAPERWQFSSRPSLLPETETDTPTIKAFLEDENGTLWVALDNQVFKGQKTENDSSYTWESVEPLHFVKSEGIRFHPEENGTFWLGQKKSLIRYASESDREVKRPEPPFRALVRQVTTLRNDRIAYGGAVESPDPDTSLTLPYAGNDLRFDVAAPLYGTVTSHRYQYKLAGHTDGWSDWTEQANVTYTNLWEGTYRFQVRARNERGQVSQAGTLTLRIQPPWYRTGWAYLLYGLGFVLLGLAFRHYFRVKRERERARKQAQQLEREREAKKQLERANQRLREANRLKEEFLANTSHELRTPLTNILGFIDVLRDTATNEQERFLSAIEENGKRLERTLTALLDLSRLRSGNGEPNLKPTAVGQHAHRVVSEFREDAEEKGLMLRVDAPSEPIYARADEQYFEQILRNLIENAIKFTEDGHVTISVDTDDEHVHVSVEDTGIGIDEEFLPDLFEDFKQESRGMARSYEGYGLGLSISSRLAKLMGASIDVDSTKGEGSTFTLHLSRFTAAMENGKASGTKSLPQES